MGEERDITCNGVREWVAASIDRAVSNAHKRLTQTGFFPLAFIHVVSDYRYSWYLWVSGGHGSCSIEHSLHARLWIVENRHHSHFSCTKQRKHFVRIAKAKQHRTITVASYLILDWQLRLQEEPQRSQVLSSSLSQLWCDHDFCLRASLRSFRVGVAGSLYQPWVLSTIQKGICPLVSFALHHGNSRSRWSELHGVGGSPRMDLVCVLIFYPNFQIHTLNMPFWIALNTQTWYIVQTLQHENRAGSHANKNHGSHNNKDDDDERIWPCYGSSYSHSCQSMIRYDTAVIVWYCFAWIILTKWFLRFMQGKWLWWRFSTSQRRALREYSVLQLPYPTDTHEYRLYR